jgi:hypothetical protein
MDKADRTASARTIRNSTSSGHIGTRTKAAPISIKDHDPHLAVMADRSEGFRKTID